MLSLAHRDFIVSILDEAADLTIVTLRAGGWPQATTVSFPEDGLWLYFGANAQSQKAQNIARDNRVSVTPNCPYDDDWHAISGLSIGRRAQRVGRRRGDEAAKVGALMTRTFPHISQFVDASAGFEMAFFRIDAEVISVLDYSKGFGHVELLTV